MYEKLRERVEELFQDAPRTNRAYELKEEVLANLIDRYNDLIEQGKSEDEAINSAMSGVGDVEELIRGLKQNDVFNYEEMKKERQKSALMISISVGLYIMSVVVLIISNEFLGVNDAISVSLMLTIDAVATGLIIYNGMSKSKYIKEDNTMVEEFKEWKSTNRKKNGVMQSIKSIVWTLIVAIYLLISFVFNAWAFSWIIFIVGAAIERIITLSFQLKE
ncbi:MULTISPECIES: permease prefix domain 1-containing protein [Clostridium]|uniref:Uncharacterized protein n=1 Tax=Clostridium paridis TaxID=2803863 RepID=A0A937FHE9_9CLOT|nr:MULTISPECIES: permease prefix domain 1-containing protein [Clostridium]MBL4933439.1 hypothetical protein [Clostridium paridis]